MSYLGRTLPNTQRLDSQSIAITPNPKTGLSSGETVNSSKPLFILSGKESLLPVALFLIFVLITIPGITWGLPSLWNPDELVWRVQKALGGELRFDENEPDFNYPSLPKYVMYGIGKITYGLGYSSLEFFTASRLVSALLGGVSVILAYAIARQMGGSVYVGTLAALLMMSCSTLSENARFAHNDLYLLFFSLMMVYSLVRYRLSGNRLWLYLAFLSVGLAASSKYTGGTLIVVVITVYLAGNWGELKKDLTGSLETLFISIVLAFLGFAVGTPKALLWMTYYFKRMLPAMFRFRVYGAATDVKIGLTGQWSTLQSALGSPLYFLFMASLIWIFVKLTLFYFRKIEEDEKKMKSFFTLLLTIIVFDLPLLVSYNYVPRFFLPLVPLLAVFSAFFVEQLFKLAGRWKYSSYARIGIGIGVLVVLSYSALRIASTMLLFVNDARIPASDFLTSLPKGTSIEYTLYPPNVPKNHFSRAHNYPIYFIKYPGEVVPAKRAYNYNEGEAGLDNRQTDYLVIDTLTYARFSDPQICKLNPVECDFFGKLLSGQTKYRQLAEFTYFLPAWLPRLDLGAVNPGVRVFERIN